METTLHDCDADGVSLSTLLMSDDHHQERDILWHSIDTLQLGSRGGARCWAQCHLRQMNDLDQWIAHGLQEAACRFLNKNPDDMSQCVVFVDIIHSDKSRREGPLLLPPAVVEIYLLMTCP